MTDQKLYFGHPLSVFDTELEERLVEEIRSEFPKYEVENPNQEKHKQNYEIWEHKDGKNGMDYYFEEVLPDMDAGVFMAFEDGKYGAGVVGEAQFLAENGNEIYSIDQTGDIEEITVEEIEEEALSIEETRERL